MILLLPKLNIYCTHVSHAALLVKIQTRIQHILLLNPLFYSSVDTTLTHTHIPRRFPV